MGALATAVQNRLSTQRLIELTNADQEGATTANTTMLGYAETDASAEFFHRTGVTFDATNGEHIMVGFFGVLSKLYDYKGLPRSPAGDAARKEWLDHCSAFCRTRGALAWQSPQTSSTLVPSSDPAGTPLPYFDRRNLQDLVPNNPNRSDDDQHFNYPG